MKNLLQVLLALVFGVFLVSCSYNNLQNKQIKGDKIIIKDTQETKEVPLNPKNVIIFDPTLLDSLDAAGITNFMGVPQRVNVLWPKPLQKYQKKPFMDVGTLHEPDFELVSELNPDLIFVGGRAYKSYKQLNNIAPSIMFNITQNEHMLSNLKEVSLTAATIFGKEPEMQKQVNILDESIKRFKAIAPKVGKVLFLMINGDKMTAFGPGSRFGFLYDELGLKPAGDFRSQWKHGENISFEYIFNLDPDWILVLDRGTTIGNVQSKNRLAQAILDNEVIHQTKAYKNRTIYYLDGSEVYIAPGLRSMTHLLDALSLVFTKGKVS